MKTRRPNSAAAETFPPEALKREIYRMYVLSNLFQRIFKLEIEAKDGVTLVEWKIIESVFHSPGIVASDIIGFWELDKTAASRAIVRLEKTAVLKRRVSERDGRRYELFLTGKGRRLFTKLQNFKEDVFQDIERHLSRAELHQMGDTTEKMIDHLRKMLNERAP